MRNQQKALRLTCLVGNYNLMKMRPEGAIYLLAARTGLMLTYKYLDVNQLPAPYTEFLETLLQPAMNSEHKELVTFAEKEIIRASLKRTKDGDLIYRTNENDEIPLYAASSAAVDLCPLLLAIQSGYKTILIEEPEAHLHPALQKKMAQLLIKMLNAGINVCFSTNSDVILQHVNNMIHLKKHPDRRKLMEQFGYYDDDLLDASDVTIYQIDAEGRFEKAECNEYGFIIPTLNEALDEILDEVYALRAAQPSLLAYS